jgi:competence CoiA-like predicted nuclease
MSLIPFAYSTPLKKLVDVSDVPSGLSCMCLCPSCNMKLLARKGEVNEHHFSHFDKAINDCNYSYWVSVRDMAKQILEASRYIKVKLNSISTLQVPPYSSQSNRIELFHIKKVQESDYIATTSIGKIKIYLSTPEHTKYSQIIKQESFTDNLVLDIDLSQYQNSKKSALEMLIINDTKCKTFLLPYHQLREQEESYSDESNSLEEEINKPIIVKVTQSDEDEILQKLYLDRRNIQAGMLKTIREMKPFYYESVFDCMHVSPSKEFEVVRSNGIIDYIFIRRVFLLQQK